jgi:hypothetical protein
MVSSFLCTILFFLHRTHVNLPELSPYIVTIKVGVKDLAGNKTTSPYSILFSTGSTLVNDNCLYDEGTFGGCLYK